MFAGGKNVYTDAIPIGGQHVTNDIARGLSTGLAHAERLKTLHGSAIATASDDQVMVEVPPLGEEESDEATTLPRSMLVGVIRPRIEEIFEMIRSKIEMGGAAALPGRRRADRRGEPAARACAKWPRTYWENKCASAARAHCRDWPKPRPARPSPPPSAC